MLRCGPEVTGNCMENADHYYEVLHCKRFHNDESGPWFMISDGMSGSKCGEEAVKIMSDKKLRFVLNIFLIFFFFKFC